MRPDPPPDLWKAAGTPVGAHALASAACDPDEYAYVRGVAQQAARLARATGLSREARALVLASAWLSWSGPGVTARPRALDGPHELRRAGHEDLARVLAWAGAATLLGGGAVADDPYPLPTGDGARALILLDVALVTTDAAGAAAPPALVLRGLAECRGASDASVAAFIGLVADLADHPEARVLIEAVSPQQAAAGL